MMTEKSTEIFLKTQFDSFMYHFLSYKHFGRIIKLTLIHFFILFSVFWGIFLDFTFVHSSVFIRFIISYFSIKNSTKEVEVTSKVGNELNQSNLTDWSIN